LRIASARRPSAGISESRRVVSAAWPQPAPPVSSQSVLSASKASLSCARVFVSVPVPMMMPAPVAAPRLPR
jgi:hypothetical protein